MVEGNKAKYVVVTCGDTRIPERFVVETVSLEGAKTAISRRYPGVLQPGTRWEYKKEDDRWMYVRPTTQGGRVSFWIDGPICIAGPGGMEGSESGPIRAVQDGGPVHLLL